MLPRKFRQLSTRRASRLRAVLPTLHVCHGYVCLPGCVMSSNNDCFHSLTACGWYWVAWRTPLPLQALSVAVSLASMCWVAGWTLLPICPTCSPSRSGTGEICCAGLSLMCMGMCSLSVPPQPALSTAWPSPRYLPAFLSLEVGVLCRCD